MNKFAIYIILVISLLLASVGCTTQPPLQDESPTSPTATLKDTTSPTAEEEPKDTNDSTPSEDETTTATIIFQLRQSA